MPIGGENEPQFLLRDCGCGKEGCRSIIMAMIHPNIGTFDGQDETLFFVHFPAHAIPSLIERLKEMAEEKGVDV